MVLHEFVLNCSAKALSCCCARDKEPAESLVPALRLRCRLFTYLLPTAASRPCPRRFFTAATKKSGCSPAMLRWHSLSQANVLSDIGRRVRWLLSVVEVHANGTSFVNVGLFWGSRLGGRGWFREPSRVLLKKCNQLHSILALLPSMWSTLRRPHGRRVKLTTRAFRDTFTQHRPVLLNHFLALW